MTNYEYLKNNEEVMIDIVVNANKWLDEIDGEYCFRLCPHRRRVCLCGDDCEYPPLDEVIKAWLRAEHR